MGERRLTDEQSRLAGEHFGFAKRLLRKVSGDQRLDDLDSMAASIVMDIARTFCPSKGVPFRAYLITLAWRRVAEARRNEQPSGLRRVKGVGDGAGRSNYSRKEIGKEWLDGDITDPRTIKEATAGRIRAEDLIKAAPPSHREILRMMYVDGLTQAQVASKTGKDRATISLKHKKAIESLRETLAESQELSPVSWPHSSVRTGRRGSSRSGTRPSQS